MSHAEAGSQPPTLPPTLPDLLHPGLDLVFVGINPGEASARLGHYYGHPGNAFWRLLSGSPLVARTVTATDDRTLLDGGIGFTDLVKRVVTDSTQVTAEELRTAIPAFLERLGRAAPRAVCFTGARQFTAIYPRAWHARGWGRQPVPALAGAAVWVIPSTSGRAARYRGEAAAVLRALAASLGRTRAKDGR